MFDSTYQTHKYTYYIITTVCDAGQGRLLTAVEFIRLIVTIQNAVTALA